MTEPIKPGDNCGHIPEQRREPCFYDDGSPSEVWTARVPPPKVWGRALFVVCHGTVVLRVTDTSHGGWSAARWWAKGYLSSADHVARREAEQRLEDVAKELGALDVESAIEAAARTRRELAAYKAERAAKVALEARVRELEAERDAAVARAEVAEAAEKSAAKAWEPLCDQRNAAHALLDHVRTALGLSLFVSDPHAELPRLVAEVVANLAETRAQLARLREAVEFACRTEDGDVADWTPCGPLRAALSTPGPTLAEVRRAAQAEVLREMAEAARSDLDYADNGECVAYWLRQRADDLEADSAHLVEVRSDR